jgi:hypothetical protein
MKDISIDFIKEKDLDQLIPLCALHSEYERVPFESKDKKEKLGHFLFQEKPPLFCLVAMKKQKMIGYFNLGCISLHIYGLSLLA